MKKFNRLLIWILVAALMAMPVVLRADDPRYQYDENFPYGTFSLANFRAALRGLAQMDIMPLRPHAKRVLDAMEYGTDASAAAAYAGTGVTITTDASVKQEGSYALKAVIDGTNDRTFARTFSINLSAYQQVTVWTYSSATSSAIQFYLSDGTNSSYWAITTDSSASTWKQHTLTLASPDSNSGSPASLAAVTSYGYRLLDNGVTYRFDTIKAINGLAVAVRGTQLGSYYENVYLGISPLLIDAKSSPTITAPTSNPRIDILTIDSAGTLAWVTGTEASTPTVPWTSLAQNKIPICLVYNKTTETKILDYEDKDTDSNQGYISADVRPFLNLGGGNPLKGADVASASTVTLGNDGYVFDITGTTTITSITAKAAGTVVWLQFDGILTVTDGSNLKLNGNFVTAAQSVLQLFSDGTNWYEVSRQPTASTFLGLTDTPSSYSGQATKYPRVNAGESAIEFVDPMNTSTGHDHDGSDSKKNLYTNLDMTGITSGQFLINNGGTPAGADPSPTQVNDVETDGVTFSNSVQADVLSVAKTITSGKTVFLSASGYVQASAGSLVTPTIRLKNGTTISQTIVMGTIYSGDKQSWACSAIVTGLSGSVTFSVTAIAGEQQGGDMKAFGNLTVVEF